MAKCYAVTLGLMILDMEAWRRGMAGFEQSQIAQTLALHQQT